MSTGQDRPEPPTGDRPDAGPEPTEEELRAAYEDQIKRVRVEHIVLEHVVTLINLGMRRTGLSPGTEAERDPDQVRLAVESVRALLPLVEQSAPQQAGPIRDALSQLQLAYVKIGGEDSPPAGDTPTKAPGEPGAGAADRAEPESDQGGAEEPGPAQRSGRLWVPGQ